MLSGMAVIRIVSISGSLQARSSNLSLVDSLSSLAGPEVEVTRWDGLRGLPHFDLDANEAPPPEVCAWRDVLRAADAVLIATPEYGHSLPGALKNGIDWVFSSGELYRKPVAITAASTGPGRGRRGIAALHQTLGALDALVLGGEPIARGPGAEEAARALLSQLVAAARHVRAGHTELPPVVLPEAIEALLRGTLLRAPLVTRLWVGDESASPTEAQAWQALAGLLHDSLQGAPASGPGLVVARLDGLLDGDARVPGTRLLEDLLARVDATPTLAVLLEQLGPRALAHLA